MKAYHFIKSDYTYRDGTKAEVGVPVVYGGELELCRSGPHVSEHPYDALQYAPGPVLCLVECEGPFVHDKDKFVCTKRTIVAWADVTETMRKFARICALDVVHLWDAPGAVIEYLKTGKEECRDASWAASWDAARAAEQDAELDAAQVAARAAARAASWAAAWDAAWAATWDAAQVAAWDAARDASWAASWDAARAASLDDERAVVERKQRKRFKAMCDRKLRGYK